jgi:hypothetical protein
MPHNLEPGAVFPDYRLPDHTDTLLGLSRMEQAAEGSLKRPPGGPSEWPRA